MSWFRKYEHHAEMRSKEWSITVDDAADVYELQGGRCALTGVPLSTNGQFRDITASLDRIDNAVGYRKDNIQWVHKSINMMRGDMTLESFVTSCQLVAAFADKVKW